MNEGWVDGDSDPSASMRLRKSCCQTITVASGNPRLVWEWVIHLVLVVVESKQWFMPFK